MLISALLLTASLVYGMESKTIHEAVKNGDIAKVLWFIEDDPSLINKQDRNNYTPLHWASFLNHVEIARLLLGCDSIQVNQVSNDGCTPLILAVQSGNKEIVRLLLERDDIQVNLQEEAGFTALSGAVIMTSLLYLSYKANPDQLAQCDFDKAYSDRIEIIHLLLEHPYIQVDLPSNNGSTLLDVAIASGQEDLIRLLLLHKANSN